jgi:hypothetical protein
MRPDRRWCRIPIPLPMMEGARGRWKGVARSDSERGSAGEGREGEEREEERRQRQAAAVITAGEYKQCNKREKSKPTPHTLLKTTWLAGEANGTPSESRRWVGWTTRRTRLTSDARRGPGRAPSSSPRRDTTMQGRERPLIRPGGSTIN